jgi:hypothetical protein
LGSIVRNRFPYNGDYRTSSFCDFYIYWPKEGPSLDDLADTTGASDTCPHSGSVHRRSDAQPSQLLTRVRETTC